MTHCFGRPEGLESLLQIAKRLWEEFVFEALFNLLFSRQPTTGLGTTKQRHPEKAGTIMQPFSKVHAHRRFCFFVCELWWFYCCFPCGTERYLTSTKRFFLTLVTGVPLQSEYD